MNILGISCYYHDAAACLITNGVIAGAASEEAFTRKKHDPAFPRHAIAFVLDQAGLSVKDLSAVIFYDKPFQKLDRALRCHIEQFPKGLGLFISKMPHWFSTQVRLPTVLEKEIGYKGPVLYSEHHLSHAASAYYASGWEEAAVLTVDGVGEWSSSSWGKGVGNKLELWSETRFPHSLGLLYSAMTRYLGFKVNSAEYKVMGLGPYGKPNYVEQLRKLIRVAGDGSFRLDMDYFEFDRGERMYNEKLEALLGHKEFPLEFPELTDFRKDVARSLQVVVDEAMIKIATHVVEQTGCTRLCMAGGVALNCVANGEILRRSPVTELFVQPAAGDAGGAMGAALFAWNGLLDKPRLPRLPSVYLGPGYGDGEIEAELKQAGLVYEKYERGALLEESARLLAAGKVVGWFQGRMEWGPRALGHRSILGDPRHPEMRKIINMKIKFREGFRPFAPSVLEEDVGEWFDLDCPSPYMLLVAQVRAGKIPLPAITHVDGSARIQTISRDQDDLYYDLIAAFKRQTGVGILINTSMNVRGEPVVCSPEDGWKCFMRTEMDGMVMGSFLMRKEKQPSIKLASAVEAFGHD